MGDIKRLPKAVHGSVRSGIVVFDLARVVEELIFNSIDAGATKISIEIGGNTCYVKVVDNGCGITRDGLVLVGERYATSKVDQLADIDAVAGSFGFRGEALSSISNVSLLEVITKAHGRPNGYRKVMKGCKCLYLGIDDGRQEVGTTVIVRDLFYNQPVRRKFIQSSDDELFCTAPSPSPLALLMSCFGIEVSNSLYELEVCDGVLKLSGYMSSPHDSSCLKAFQYVYVNSLYICKGQIHKMLNQLTTRFKSLDMQKANLASLNTKRSRSQTNLSYILNLSCPRSWYDTTFEPSKTSVEFKDWFPIISFIEKAIKEFWRENFSYGHDLDCGTNMPGETHSTSLPEEGKYEISKRRRRIRNDSASFGFPSPSLEIRTHESDYMSNQIDNRFSYNSSEFKDHKAELRYTHQTDNLFQSGNGLPSSSRVSVDLEATSYMQSQNNNTFSNEDHFLANESFNAEKCNKCSNHILGSSLEDDCHDVDPSISNEVGALSCELLELDNDINKVHKHLKMPFLKNCSLKRSLLDGEPLVRSEGFDSEIDGFRIKRKRLEPDGCDSVGEVDKKELSLNFLKKTLWPDEAASSWSSPSHMTEYDMPASQDFLSRDSLWSSAIGGDFSTRENDLNLDSGAYFTQCGLSHQSFDYEWFNEKAKPQVGIKTCSVGHYIGDHERYKYDIDARYGHLADRETESFLSYFNDRKKFSSIQENGSLSCRISKSSDFESCTKKGDWGFLQHHYLDDVQFSIYSDAFSDKTQQVCLEFCGKSNHNSCTVTSHPISSSIYDDKDENQNDRTLCQYKEYACDDKRSKRSHSAPPLYRGKRKFCALNQHLTMEAGKLKMQAVEDSLILQETCELKQSQTTFGECQQQSELKSHEDLVGHGRPDKKKLLDVSHTEQFNRSNQLEDFHIYQMNVIEDVQDPSDSGLKWKKSRAKFINGDKLHNLENECAILDISSGMLHLAADSLVPESIHKSCLEEAKVLHQVDKKFIPVVGGGVLALIDQHAADERIRLEELRQKVLSGENKTITYLDREQKLVLPEVEYQLLHNYAEQIQNWGWLCSIPSPGSRSFTKNLNLLHKRPTAITLVAVRHLLLSLSPNA
ncbi:hypothetical protein NMG60_11007728 [Bertholletia excelsa]